MSFTVSAVADLASKKRQLLSEIAPLRRGLRGTQVERKKVERICEELEKRNPTKAPLTSELINGEWELIYTTSDSILGTKRPGVFRPQGPIYQIIGTGDLSGHRLFEQTAALDLDAPNLRAKNRETWPFFSEVTADLTAMTESKVAVQFDTFKILGLIPFKAPESAKGTLDTTFLDEEIRISRGDKGNLFVLSMKDQTVKP